LSDGFVPFLHVTTHIDDKEGDDLLSDYEESSFPAFLVLDSKGGLLARHRGPTRLAAFRATLEKVGRVAELASKAAAGDKVAGIDLALLRCELHAIDLADLEELIEGKPLSDAQKITFASLGAGAEVTDMRTVVRRARFSADALSDAGEMFIDYFDKGGVPLAKWDRGLYWLGLGYYAVTEKKKDLYARAVKELDALAESDRLVKAKLADLKSKAPG
jgi:hypothetical protein